MIQSPFLDTLIVTTGDSAPSQPSTSSKVPASGSTVVKKGKQDANTTENEPSGESKSHKNLSGINQFLWTFWVNHFCINMLKRFDDKLINNPQIFYIVFRQTEATKKKKKNT